MKTKPNKTFDFAIIRILDCGFILEEAIPADNGKVNLGYGMKMFVDLNSNIIQFVLKAEFKNIDYPAPIVNSTVLTKFVVKELSGFLNKENKFEFPIGGIESIFGIAFSHLRAITAKNLGGSRHFSLLLPPINNIELFKTLLADNISLLKSNPESFVPEEILSLNLFYDTENIKSFIP